MALDCYNQNPNHLIISNCHIYNGNYPKSKELLDRFLYTPYLFVPEKMIKRCFVIIDDYSNLDHKIDILVKAIANKARKKDIDVVITGQDKTMVKASLRRQAKHIIFPLLSRDNKRMKLKFYKENEKYQMIFQFQRIIRIDFDNLIKFYNTYEVVKQLTHRIAIQEIKRISQNLHDLDLNISGYTSNTQTQLRLFKQLGKELGFL